MSQELVKSDLQKFNRFIKHDKTQQHIQAALGEKSQEFVSNCLAIVSTNSTLAECEPTTVMNCILKATTLDLSMQLGHSWAVPYNDKKSGQVVAQFQVGAKGLMQLAMRTDKVKFLNVAEIKQGEVKIGNPLTGEIEFNFIQDIEERAKAKTIGKAAYIELKNGFRKTLFMTIEQIHIHAKKYSKSYNSQNAPWKTETSKMEDKTIMKKLLNSGEIPLSIKDKQLTEALKIDQAVLPGLNPTTKPLYPDNPQNDPVINPENVDKAKQVFKGNFEDIDEAEVIPEAQEKGEPQGPPA